MSHESLIHEITKLGVQFGQELNTARIALYVDHLSDLAEEKIIHACCMASRTCKFFPSVAELRDLAGDSSSVNRDLAEAKWYELRQLTGSLAYSASALEDPLVKICFHRLGGHAGFGRWDYENDEVWRRKQFCESYTALARCQERGLLTQVNRSEASGVLDALLSNLTARQTEFIPKTEQEGA